MAKSKVITFKLPAEEYFLIVNYVDYEQLSISEFLVSIINNFLLIDYSIENSNKWLINELKDTLKIKQIQTRSELKVVSVRFSRDDLDYWDMYCEQKIMPRTSLIRQSILNFFYPNGKEQSKIHRDNLEKIIYNLILGTGSIYYDHLNLIFKSVNPSIINKILKKLEENGMIGKKGDEKGILYVPIFESEKSIGQHFLAEILSRLF